MSSLYVVIISFLFLFFLCLWWMIRIYWSTLGVSFIVVVYLWGLLLLNWQMAGYLSCNTGWVCLRMLSCLVDSLNTDLFIMFVVDQHIWLIGVIFFEIPVFVSRYHFDRAVWENDAVVRLELDFTDILFCSASATDGCHILTAVFGTVYSLTLWIVQFLRCL